MPFLEIVEMNMVNVCQHKNVTLLPSCDQYHFGKKRVQEFLLMGFGEA